MRNIVKTVASLPETFHSQIIVDINDRHVDTVARNAILLLLIHTSLDVESAAHCVLHLWYSTLITQDCHDRLAGPRRLIEEVCSKNQDEPADTFLEKTWEFPDKKSTLTFVFQKKF